MTAHGQGGRQTLRVVLEFNSVLANRYSGFFSYGAGLLEGFVRLEDRPELVLWCGRKAWPGRQWLGELPAAAGATWRTLSPFKPRHLGLWWRRMPWPAVQAFTGPCDLYHCNHHLMPPTKGRPRVLTVHDLRRYRYPEFYPHSKLDAFENAVRKADHFIAISRATRDDLCRYLNVPPERVDVVYHGGALAERPAAEPADDAEALERFGLAAGRYFVAFSSYDRRKNIPAVLGAFARALPRLGGDYRLAVIGKFPADQQAMTAGGQAAPAAVVCTGPLADVGPLLRQSRGLVYASLYEGFGLPILEAMSAGTAVITSNCSSMPEVAGDAALLVEPTDQEAIADAMVSLAADDALRQRLISLGQDRLKMFSWRRAAGETLGVYRKLT